MSMFLLTQDTVCNYKKKQKNKQSKMYSSEVLWHFSRCIIHNTHLFSRQLPPSEAPFVLYSAMYLPRAIIIHYKSLQSTVTEHHYDEVGFV